MPTLRDQHRATQAILLPPPSVRLGSVWRGRTDLIRRPGPSRRRPCLIGAEGVRRVRVRRVRTHAFQDDALADTGWSPRSPRHCGHAGPGRTRVRNQRTPAARAPASVGRASAPKWQPAHGAIHEVQPAVVTKARIYERRSPRDIASAIPAVRIQRSTRHTEMITRAHRPADGANPSSVAYISA
jgi:hypothetical protein